MRFQFFRKLLLALRLGLKLSKKKGNSFPATVIDQIQAGDGLQVHIIPQKESVLLKSGIASGSLELILPAVNQSY
jgi:hypothetical protein